MEDRSIFGLIEVDLSVPIDRWEFFSEMCPIFGNTWITESDLSPVMKEYMKENEIKFSPVRNLVGVMRAEKILLTTPLLQFYMKHGLKLKKIHRVLSFKQSPWMQSYIDFNTKQRTLATSTEDKNLFKLANNAVFGRCCLNLRKQINVKLSMCEKQSKRYVARPTYESHTQINDELVLIKLRKSVIHWDKPTYVGFCILELSKIHMYEMHYDVILPKYGDNAKLLFTDTDSLCYELRTNDYYDDILDNKHIFDL